MNVGTNKNSNKHYKIPPQIAIFNEQTLREEIKKQWGEYGAHMDLYDRILKTKIQFLNYDQYIDFEVQTSSFMRLVFIKIFPSLYRSYFIKKHNRYLKYRYPANE